ncbi:MAG: 23S rRNA (guanine2445-N2)-methyltransferase / 23S rRNA (guanine2069-N7)-methyltransferase [Bradymonadia bacterium]|jgi:23S rRNA (guanine2445-N2)-methyltransferase / 23S rRNA (guanine2069-N7)-methyltransferase
METPDLSQCFFLATASRGTEGLLADELRTLGAKGIDVVHGGVTFNGPIQTALRICLWSRIALRVLLQIGLREVRDEHALYKAARSLPLDDWFEADRTFAVFSRVRDNDALKHSKYAALKVKDAIVDHVRDRQRRRPNVDPARPDISLTLHIRGTQASFYLDLCGAPLNQRGYRVRDVDAPAKETLAAALLAYSGWRPPTPLHDPTCGSGTIAIEAALIATNTAPGLLNGDLAALRWRHSDTVFRPMWDAMIAEAKEQRVPYRGVIIASDSDHDAVAAARANAGAAGVADIVIVRQADAREVQPLLANGHFIANPPYGERIGGELIEVEDLYDELASAFAKCPDNPMTMLAVRDTLEPHFGAADTRMPVLNGKLRCEFANWE